MKDPRKNLLTLPFWKRIAELEATPRAVAGGLSIGMFFGLVPLFGLKTILTLGVSGVLRYNPIAAFFALSLYDLLLPFLPVLMRIQYDIGFWLLNHPHHLPPKLELLHLHPTAYLHWTTFLHAGLPLLLGSLVVAVPVAALTYLVTLPLLTSRAKKKSAAATS